MKPPISRWASAGLYLIALAMVFSPFLDLVSTVWPLRPGELTWRYGALGLTAGYLQTPVLGLVLVMGVAYGLHHASVLRMAGVSALLAAVTLLAAATVFAFDLVAMRALRPGDSDVLLISGCIQVVKYSAAFLALGCLGVGCLLASRRGLSRAAAPRGPSPGSLRAEGA